MKLNVVKTPIGYIPARDADKDSFNRQENGKEYKANITAPRDYEFHKKAFTLFNFIHQQIGCNWFPNADETRKELTKWAGFKTTFTDPHGNIKEYADSLSFGNMDEVCFSHCYEAIKRVAIDWLNTTAEELDKELESEAMEMRKAINTIEQYY